MKRAGNLIEKIADPDNLRLAFCKARKGKAFSGSVLRYQKPLDENLLTLRTELQSGKVSVGAYKLFKVFDPKERQICAAAFGEQVLHHAIMNICHPYFERVQVFDSYASRKHKGTYAALDRAKKYSGKYAYFLKLDIRKFFETMHHSVLKSQLDKLFKDNKLIEIFNQIIDSYQTPGELEPKGVPIGNLSSQYFANHYLSSLDHYIKEELKFKAYVRYMDDMILWHDDPQVLKNAWDQIKAFVENHLQCNLKPPMLNQCRKGLPFLGYVIFPNQVRLTQRSKKRFLQKIRFVDEQYHAGNWSDTQCRRHLLPLIAFINHANTEEFRKKAMNNYI